ncbi:MAG: NitT/TauT family transport system substrate-binding protein [Tepidanaerobacteraceae bacterium]|nr:NitT/TauT family transport system substrate-binding protein [Tepidanaerobacteraceae bacterium]
MRKLLILTLIIPIFLLNGCSIGKKDTVKKVEAYQSDAVVVKIGVLPDVDSVPFIAADAKGYFDREGVKVELVSFNNPVERDAALQSGSIDGEVGDILAAAFAVQNGIDVKITSVTCGKYDILAAPNSGIKDANGLLGKKVALSKNTIIEYVVDNLLAEKGISDKEIEKIIVSKMPVRLEMLKSGKVDAACLPEPLSSLAVKAGAKILLSTKDSLLVPGVMLFTQEAINSKKDFIKKVYRAYEKVTRDINANPENFRDVLATAHFPEEVAGNFEFPQYTKLSVPTEGDINQVLHWMQNKGLLKKRIGYKDMVDDSVIK